MASFSPIPFDSMNKEWQEEDSLSSCVATLLNKDEMDYQGTTDDLYFSTSPCCSVDNFDPNIVSPSTASTRKDVILFDQDMMEDWWESNSASMQEDTTFEDTTFEDTTFESELHNASHHRGSSEDGCTTHIVKPSTTREDLMTLYLEQILLEIKNKNIPFICGDVWAPPETTHKSYSTEDRALLVDYPFLDRYSTVFMKGLPRTLQTDILERPSELTRSFLLGVAGRVYSSKTALVEKDIHEAMEINLPNVKSVLGIPVHNTRFGNFVALFYSPADIKLDNKRILDEVNHVCERVIFDENDNVYVAKGGKVSTPKTALFSSEDIEELVSLLSKHIPADNSKAEKSPDFFASIQSFISLRIILLRSESSYTADEKANLQTIKQSWLSYLKNSMLDEKDIANRLVREWMLLQQM